METAAAATTFDVLVYHFVGGAYVVGYGDSFEEDLHQLVAQFGPPVSAARSTWNDSAASVAS